MEYFLQQLINGLTLGSIYGLIAIGYTMVYGIIGMINFAHGDIFMVGAFIALIAFLLIMSLGLTLIPLALVLVLIIAMLLTAMWGWTVERIAYRPLRESFRLAPLITAIGMSIVLSNFTWEEMREGFLQGGACAYFDKSLEFRKARDWVFEQAACKARQASQACAPG